MNVSYTHSPLKLVPVLGSAHDHHSNLDLMRLYEKRFFPMDPIPLFNIVVYFSFITLILFGIYSFSLTRNVANRYLYTAHMLVTLQNYRK